MTTSSSGGTDIVRLGIQVDATQPERAAESVEKLGTATVRAAKDLDTLGEASRRNAEWTRRANEQYENKIQALQRLWREEQAALAAEKQLEAARQVSLKTQTDFIAKLEQMVAQYGKTREELLRMHAAQLNVSSSAEPLIAKLEQMKATALAHKNALKQVHGHTNEVSDATNKLGNVFSTARSKTELLVLAHEALQGRYTRMPGSLMVLAEYTGMASVVMSGTALAIGGVVAALVLFGYEIVKGALQTREINNALNETNGYAGRTTGSLMAMANSMGQVHGQFDAAYEVIGKVASSGKFAKDEIGQVTKAVLDFEYALSRPVAQSIKEFESLIVKSTDRSIKSYYDVTKALVTLDEKYHFLNASQLDVIIQLEKEGKTREASTEAIRLYSEEGKRASVAAEEYMGSIEKGWHAVLKAINKVKDGMASIGRKTSTQDDIAQSEKMIAFLIGSRKIDVTNDDDVKKVAGLKNKLEELSKFKAKLAAEDKKAEEESIKRQNESIANRSKQELAVRAATLLRRTENEKEYDLARYHEKLEAIRLVNPNDSELDPKRIKEYTEAIERFHKQRKTSTVDDGRGQELRALLDAAKNEYDVLADSLKNEEALLLENQKAGLATNREYYAKLGADRDVELAARVKMYETEMKALMAYKALSARDAEETKRRIQNTTADFIKSSNDIQAAKAKAEFKGLTSGDSDVNKLASKDSVEAGKMIERAEALDQYGKKARETALQVAELQLAEIKRKETVSESAEANFKAQATLKDLASAYLALENLHAELNNKVRTASEENLKGVIGAEGLKVAVWKTSAEQFVQLEWEKAQAAINAARAASTTGRGSDAQEDAFEKAAASHKKATAQISKVSKMKFEVAGLKDTATEFDKLAKSAGVFGDRFQGVVKGFQGFSAAMKDLAKQKEREDQNEKVSSAEKIGTYGDMAEAASSFFDKHTAGYKTMHGAAQAFHAAEMAMTMIRMAINAVGAIIKAAEQTGWPGMIAMGAAMAALGFAVGGGFNSHEEGGSAAEVQAAQGLGTVLGDPTAKSESVTKALEQLRENSDESMPISLSMLASLRRIDAAMTGLAQIVIRSTGISSGNALNVFEGTIAEHAPGRLMDEMAGIDSDNNWVNKIDFGITQMGDDLAASIVRNFFGKTSQEIIDSGLRVKGTLGEVSQGEGIDQYATIQTTTKRLFGALSNSSNRMEYGAVDQTISDQLGLVFKGISDTLLAASSTFTSDTDGIRAKLEAFVVDIPKISLRGLSGEKLQEALNNVFSAFSDKLATELLPGMEDFQNVGEGYFQTIIRIVNGVEAGKAALERFGIEAISFTEIINKQGDVGVEIMRQSIAAVEVGAGGVASGVGKIIDAFDGTVGELTELYTGMLELRNLLGNVNMNGMDLSSSMIQGAGGASELRSGLSAYLDNFFTPQEKAAAQVRDVAKQFELLGLTMPTSNAAFRALVESIDTSTDAGAKLAGGILALADPFSTALEDATSGLNDMVASLLDFKESLGVEAAGGGSRGTLAAKARVDEAYSLSLAGDQNAIAKFQSYAETFLNASKASSTDELSYQRDVIRIMNMIDNVVAAAQTQAELLMGVETETADGSHASGADYIPFDNYRARLHKGEMVLPSSIAQNVRANGGAGDSSGLAESVKELNRAVDRGNVHLKKTYDLLVKVSRDGTSIVTTPAA